MTTEKEIDIKKDAVAIVIAEENDAPKEYGGRKKGLDATRYGDWEKDGRAIDF